MVPQRWAGPPPLRACAAARGTRGPSSALLLGLVSASMLSSLFYFQACRSPNPRPSSISCSSRCVSARTHARTHARTCARTHALAQESTHLPRHVRAHAHTHARTHARTHTQAAAYGRAHAHEYAQELLEEEQQPQPAQLPGGGRLAFLKPSSLKQSLPAAGSTLGTTTRVRPMQGGPDPAAQERVVLDWVAEMQVGWPRVGV